MFIQTAEFKNLENVGEEDEEVYKHWPDARADDFNKTSTDFRLYIEESKETSMKIDVTTETLSGTASKVGGFVYCVMTAFALLSGLFFNMAMLKIAKDILLSQSQRQEYNESLDGIVKKMKERLSYVRVYNLFDQVDDHKKEVSELQKELSTLKEENEETKKELQAQKNQMKSQGAQMEKLLALISNQDHFKKEWIN